MDARTPRPGRREAGRRLTALVALAALTLPSVRGLLCSAGGHEATHAGPATPVSTTHAAGLATAGSATAHAHGPGAGQVRETADRLPPPGVALDRASTHDAGCHALMSCGVTLVAAEWADTPGSSGPAVGSAPERVRDLLHDRPGLGPALPPPRA